MSPATLLVLVLALSLGISPTSADAGPPLPSPEVPPDADPRVGPPRSGARSLPTLPVAEDSRTDADDLPVGARIVCTCPDLARCGRSTVGHGVWGGTNGFGLFWRPVDSPRWKRTRNPGLTSTVIRLVAQHATEPELLWIGTDLGLVLCEEEGGGQLRSATRWTAQEGLPSEEITALAVSRSRPEKMADPAGRPVLWIGTVGGLVGYDLDAREISPALTRSTAGLKDDWVRTLSVSDAQEGPSAHHRGQVAQTYTVQATTLASNRDGEQTFQQALRVETHQGVRCRAWETTTVDSILKPIRFRYYASLVRVEPTCIVRAFGTFVLGTEGDGLRVLTGRRPNLFVGALPGPPWSEPELVLTTSPGFGRGSEIPLLPSASGTATAAQPPALPADEALAMPVFPHPSACEDEESARSSGRSTGPAPQPTGTGPLELEESISGYTPPFLSIADPRVSDMLTDAHGALWAATAAGVSRLTETDRWEGPSREDVCPRTVVVRGSRLMKIETWSGRGRIPAQRVRRLVHDRRRDVLWAVGDNPKEGLGAGPVHGKLARSADVLMRHERGAWTSLPLDVGDVDAGPAGIRAGCLAVSPVDGRVFLGTNIGLLVYDGARLKRYRFSTVAVDPTPLDHLKVRPESIDRVPIGAVSVDPRGAIWAGTARGLFRDDGRRTRIYTTFHGLASGWVAEVHAGRNEVYVHCRVGRRGGYVQRMTFEPVYTDAYPRRLTRVIERISMP